jgi:hypothetical protein
MGIVKGAKREKWIDFPFSPVYSKEARHRRRSGDAKENL